MVQDYKINNIQKYINKNNEEFISIEFEQHFHYSFKDEGNLNIKKYPDNISFPVCFNIDDNIHSNDMMFKNEYSLPDISSIILVNDNNVLFEYVSQSYINNTYIIHINLNKEPVIKKKLLSKNYKKELFVVGNSDYIMIKLIYTPNMRTVKINKIIKNIKQVNL